jgi:hypothetical protein
MHTTQWLLTHNHAVIYIARALLKLDRRNSKLATEASGGTSQSVEHQGGPVHRTYLSVSFSLRMSMVEKTKCLYLSRVLVDEEEMFRTVGNAGKLKRESTCARAQHDAWNPRGVLLRSGATFTDGDALLIAE